MRSQHRGKVLPPLALVSIYTTCYLFTCILWLTGLYLLTLVLQGWSHLEEPLITQVKVEPKLPGALPMPEPVLLVGTSGEGAPGDQAPAASEEVQPAPTPTPEVSTLLTLFYRYLALAQYSAETLLTPILPCEELGLILSFVHRSPALKHRKQWGGVAGGQARAPGGRGGGKGGGGATTSFPGERSKYPLCIPCYCFSHTVQCGVEATPTSPYGEVPPSILPVSLQIGILTYSEWLPEEMGWQVKEEVEDVIVLEGGDKEDAEGVGRDAQQGGEVHPSGGTDSSLAAAAPTLEVQHAMRHAVQVSKGRALPSKTTIIAPNPALLSPPPQPASSLPGPGPIWGFDSGGEAGCGCCLLEGKRWSSASVPLPLPLQAS